MKDPIRFAMRATIAMPVTAILLILWAPGSPPRKQSHIHNLVLRVHPAPQLPRLTQIDYSTTQPKAEYLLAPLRALTSQEVSRVIPDENNGMVIYQGWTISFAAHPAHGTELSYSILAAQDSDLYFYFGEKIPGQTPLIVGPPARVHICEGNAIVFATIDCADVIPEMILDRLQ